MSVITEKTHLPTGTYFGKVIDGTAINAEATSQTMKTEGLDHLVLAVEYTYAAGTNVEVRVDFRIDGTNWIPYPFGDDSTSPYVDVADKVWRIVAPGADDDFGIFIPIHAAEARVRVIATGSPTTSDTVIVTARAMRLGS